MIDLIIMHMFNQRVTRMCEVTFDSQTYVDYICMRYINRLPKSRANERNSLFIIIFFI